MSTPTISALLAGMVVAAAVPAATVTAITAELLPPAVAHVRHRHAARCCGPCGCLHVSYVYHKELRSTYGLSFDPRNFDQTEPYYYYGPMRAYPTFWCEVGSTQ